MDDLLTDAERRLVELRRRRAALLPDRDDAETLSELVTVQGQIKAAEAALQEAHRD